MLNKNNIYSFNTYNVDNSVNIALNKQAVASSIESPSYVANYVNDRLSTRWSSEPFSKGFQWIYIDLGQITQFDSVKITWYVSYATTYRIETSNDAVTWTSVYRTTTGVGRVESINLSTKQTARYVRVYGEQNNVPTTTNNMSIYELEIYNRGIATTPTIPTSTVPTNTVPTKPPTTTIPTNTVPTSTIPIKPTTIPATTLPNNTTIKTPPILSYLVKKSFNGSTDYLDITKDLSSVKNLTTGAIVVKFNTTSTALGGTLFSMSDSTNANSHLAVLLSSNVAGRFRYEVRKNGALLFGYNTANSVNNGVLHTALISVGTRGIEGYVDGVNVFKVATSHDFFTSLTSKNSMNIGRTLDNTAKGKWYFKGTIEYVDIYNYELTVDQAKAISVNSYK